MRIKHATAGAFMFAHLEGRWRLGLIEHPRLRRLMIPGGHVEANEQVAEAAQREVLEETGIAVELLAAPVGMPLPVGYPHPQVTAPWWITELDVPADNHTPDPHIHIDHQYVAIAEEVAPGREPVHPFAWFDTEQVAQVAMFDDTRLLALALFACVADVAAGRSEAVVDALGR
jgi:8-oxo-dGTP pyrophosphatase MutT (NUDIX family)